jgi:hypothetical protein
MRKSNRFPYAHLTKRHAKPKLCLSAKRVRKDMLLQKIGQKFSYKQALLFLLIVALLLIFRYSPALSAAPGFEATWVTQPRFPAGYVKTGQIIFEHQPCFYKLLGWQGNSLFYQAECQGEVQFWQYGVSQNKRAELVTAVPLNLSQNVIPHEEALQMVRADGVRPVEYEAITREILLVGAGLAAPDGSWTAVISQHIYAPQDILLIKESP